MSQIVLYDNRASINANKVRFRLAELGLDHERREIPLRDKPAEYLKIHPFGLVPTLIDADPDRRRPGHHRVQRRAALPRRTRGAL